MWAVLDFVGSCGRHNCPFEDACVTSLVADITLGPFGVVVSFNNVVAFVTMLMVAPESAQASSFEGELKAANELAVVMGIDDVVGDLLEIRL